jgi:hypothetical protein
MKVLLWHVHGSWTTAFVQGQHEYVLPLLPDRGPDGRGRARTWTWPDRAREVPVDQLRDEPVDVVVLQRPQELELVLRWLGARAGHDIPAVYVEHNAPGGSVPDTKHPLAGQQDVPLVHVTDFNDLMWDSGRAPHVVIEHGILDPGPLWTGELSRAAVVVNDPIRRGRTTGTDLLPALSRAAPLDVFGMNLDGLPVSTGADPDRMTLHEDLPQAQMHRELARRRVYAHPMRWTSLGLSLLEAMALGMPVVALGCTEAWEAIPTGAGWVTTRVERMAAIVESLIADPAAGRAAGEKARIAVLNRYGLARFLADWDGLLKEVTR